LPKKIERVAGKIDVWIFDLDNVLYPASCNLFDLISARITAYVAAHYDVPEDEARAVQRALFMEHGTTLNGLMALDNIEPRGFLDFVHDIPMDRLSPAPELAARIADLPGRKLVFTNGDAAYAARVLEARGMGDVFEGVHDIIASGYHPKPHAPAYQSLLTAWDFDPSCAVFFEDMAVNLKPAKALGMATAWVKGAWVKGGHDWGHDPAHKDSVPDYVDYIEDSLESALDRLS
jgi:putative hydrolase of the HAD superfamily